MNSNKSRPAEKRIALEPQRSHGKLRVAALLEAGAKVIAKKGYQAATMAEIAEVAGAPIGSLYRFFPNKEILADALIQRFAGHINDAFEKIDGRIGTISIRDLIDSLLSILVDFEGERMVMRALLETHPNCSAKRGEFRQGIIQRIARTLSLRNPKLGATEVEGIAFVILHNMKMVNTIKAELKGDARAGSLTELRKMTGLYLAARLK